VVFTPQKENTSICPFFSANVGIFALLPPWWRLQASRLRTFYAFPPFHDGSGRPSIPPFPSFVQKERSRRAPRLSLPRPDEERLFPLFSLASQMCKSISDLSLFPRILGSAIRFSLPRMNSVSPFTPENHVNCDVTLFFFFFSCGQICNVPVGSDGSLMVLSPRTLFFCSFLRSRTGRHGRVSERFPPSPFPVIVEHRTPQLSFFPTGS